MDHIASLRDTLKRLCPALELREQEPMSRHTSFRIGGPARLMALPADPDQARVAVTAAREAGVVPFFLGNGTNLLVSDEGYDGFVVRCSDRSVSSPEPGILRAGAGLSLAQLAVAALERKLTGLEFAHGIPGTVGGAVTMNAGAYGGEIVQVLRSVSVLNPDGSRAEIPAAQCALGYRRSAFTDGSRLILAADFTLSEGDPAAIQGKMDDLAIRRREKQPLEYPSAGSTFKRPSGHFAAALIDRCGLKGLSVGGAQVSEKHAGFVINRGGATCRDVLELVEEIRRRVRSQTGVELELEIRLLGVGISPARTE